MRTTVTLAKDVAAAVSRLSREEGIGVSEAVNRLARRGMAIKSDRPRFIQPTFPMGAPKLDLSNIGDVLESIEGPGHR